jgi:hypothetical protein
MDIAAALKEKLGPLPVYVWLLIMTGIGVAAYLLLKKKTTAAATTGTPGTPCTMSDGSAGTWDSTGTVCQATTVSTVNAPTQSYSMAGSGTARNWRSASSTATATTTPAGTAAASTPATTAATTPPAAPATTATTGSTGTGNINSGNWSFPAPAVTVTGASKTSTQIKVSWTPVKGPGGQTPASYTVQIFRGGTQIRENVVTGTSYTENGLSKGTTGLVVNVWANGGPLAPPHGTATT